MKNKLAKLIIVITYFVIWAAALIVFWFCISGSDAMGYSIMFLWFLLPLTTFVLSILIGRNDYWGKLKWFSAAAFGVMYMLAEYATFSAANMTAFGHINSPDFVMILSGGVVSILGLVLGTAIRHYNSKEKSSIDFNA